MCHCSYQILPIQKGNPAHAEAVHRLYQENAAALHGTEISVQEWLQCLSADDPDEQNFLLYSAETPVGWLRINGLCNPDMAWISMLAIGKAHQRQGIGRFAVQFSEEYGREKGFSKLGIHTTEDNLPAQALYRSCGFLVTEYGDCTNGDGVHRKGYTFEKAL